MNILIPHSWLLEYLDTDVSPEVLQKELSLCGPSVERINYDGNEAIYDIEVTTNRVDSYSVLGIAREAAVILTQAGYHATLKNLDLPSLNTIVPSQNPSSLPLPKIVDNDHLAKRTLAVILDNLSHTPTPDWMARRLAQIEMNVHDSVIDITNYVTHELGYACHAFDYDKIMSMGGIINICKASSGEKFVTLDKQTYETVGGEVVFKNDAGEIIDLPAIKGTLNSAVDDNTKRVLFWIESLNHELVRFASMKHAIRTVAASLAEKDVDPSLADQVFAKGIKLYQELCQATIASSVADNFAHAKNAVAILLTSANVSRYLGIDLPQETCSKILSLLGCKVEVKSETELSVTPPTFRHDLNISADLVEEIARIYGYHNLPSELMSSAIPVTKQVGVDFALETKLKYLLAGLGCQELYSYSLVNEKLALESGFELKDHLKIANPLSVDQVYLRRSLVPSLAAIIAEQGTSEKITLFELAHIYEQNGQELPEQKLKLTFVSNSLLNDVKAIIEDLFASLYLAEIKINNKEEKHGIYAQWAEIYCGEKLIGNFGITKNNLVAAEIDFEHLVLMQRQNPHYKPLINTTMIVEDLTWQLAPKTATASLMEAIKKLSPLVTSVKLKDIYQQNVTFTICYQDPKRSLTNEDIKPLREQIVRDVKDKFQAALIGKLPD